MSIIMGALDGAANLRIDFLRKKIQAKYVSGLQRLNSPMIHLPQDQQEAFAFVRARLLRALVFAGTMDIYLFSQNLGVFRNDIFKLNENNFDLLYQIMIMWFFWMQTPLDTEGKKTQNGELLEMGFGINTHFSKICYDAYAITENHILTNYALFYKNCMLSVGHIDNFFDTMYENSPDCQKFIELIDPATVQAGESVK